MIHPALICCSPHRLGGQLTHLAPATQGHVSCIPAAASEGPEGHELWRLTWHPCTQLLNAGSLQAAGATAGTIAMSATYPLDMVRGRLTVQLERTGHYTGIVNAAQQIVRQVRSALSSGPLPAARPAQHVPSRA